jgi:hypothetical protein
MSLPIPIIQALCLRMHYQDLVRLMLTCKAHHTVLRSLCIRRHEQHVENAREFCIDDYSGNVWDYHYYWKPKMSHPPPCLYWPYPKPVSIYLSKWSEPPSICSPLCVKLYIDVPNQGALQEVCAWLGAKPPIHISFLVHRKRKECYDCLTNDMLLCCASGVEVLVLAFCTAVTDQAVKRLDRCKFIDFYGNPNITYRSLRLMNDLLFVTMSEIDDSMTVEWVNKRSSKYRYKMKKDYDSDAPEPVNHVSNILRALILPLCPSAADIHAEAPAACPSR